MIASITPVGYRSHKRAGWIAAVGLFGLFGAVGGAITGGIIGVIARTASTIAPSLQFSRRLVALIITSIALCSALHEAGLWRMPYPQIHWQVPSGWRARLHPWIAASLYGGVLGSGILTRITVATGVVLPIWIALASSICRGAVAMAVYGASRAMPLAIFGWGVKTPDHAWNAGVRMLGIGPTIHRLNAIILAVLATVAAAAGCLASPLPMRKNIMRIYVVDSPLAATTTRIHVFSIDGKLLTTIPALYAPEIAVSPDGGILAIAHTDAVTRRDEVQLVDARTWTVLHRVTIHDRAKYNVRPSAASILFSRDGATLYVLRIRVFGSDQADYLITAIATDTGRATGAEMKLPEDVLSVAPLPQSGDLVVALQGREIEAVAVGDPSSDREPRHLHRLIHPYTRGHEFTTAAVAIGDDGRIFHVSRNGLLRVLEPGQSELGPERQLDLGGGFVGAGHLFARRERLFVGCGSAEVVARGSAERILVFDSKTLKRLASLSITPVAESIAVAPDGNLAAAASLRPGGVAIYDVQSGRRIGAISINDITPVWIELAGDPP